MKRWLLLIASLLLLVLGSAAGRSMQNPAISNPVGRATVPPSTFRSDLTETDSPIDNTGNLMVTGNVRRGMHFRGDVPYQSTTSFNSSLGTSTLNSFLRDTAGSEDYTRPSYRYGAQPYYSQTETVTYSMPGQSGVLSPANTRISTRMQPDTSTVGANLFSLEAIPREQASFDRGSMGGDSLLLQPKTQNAPLPSSRYIRTETPSANDGSVLREISPHPWDTGRSAASQIDVRRQGESLTTDLYNRPINYDGLTTREPAQLPDLIPQQSRTAADTSLPYSSRQTQIENSKSPLDIQPTAETDILSQTDLSRYGPAVSRQFTPPGLPAERTSLPALDERNANAGNLSPQQRNVLERIRQQLDDLTKSVDASLQADSTVSDGRLPPAARGEVSLVQQYVQDSRSASSLYEQQIPGLTLDEKRTTHLVPSAASKQNYEGGQARLQLPDAESRIGLQESSSPLEELNKLSQADLSAEARRIMGPHGSVESFSKERYNQHMQAAESNLRNGLFYNAADFFAMASIYKPDDPKAVAGRGHALFAAGDYTSSALFISRALTSNPEYIQTGIDITAMVGGRENLVAKVTEVERLFQNSGSTQLQLLLAYVYYRAGAINQAKQAIDSLYQKAPQLPAVRAIKAAIEKSTVLR